MSWMSRKQVRDSLTNKSVQIVDYHVRFPTWTNPHDDLPPSGESYFKDSVLDILVLGNDNKKFYHCLLTLKDRTRELVWIHNCWIKREPSMLNRLLDWLNQ